MTKIAYIEKKFSPASADVIAKANEIMREYAAQGFSLTLRQLYYQFVARGLIPNKQTEYKRLGSIVNDGRMAGLLDWDNIEDRTRNVRAVSTWSSPASIIDSAAYGYRIDLWEEQKTRPEVWIEKDALTGVIEGVCEENRVSYFACRGYTSQSEQWRAGQRIIQRWKRDRQTTLILHLGDHDPSGIDMTRDNRERLEGFCYHHLGTVPFEMRRIALNMDQVEEFNPPPNPAKLTDSRASGYVEQWGDESWELDALDPATIRHLIEENIESVRMQSRWDTMVARENREKGQLESVREHWEEVAQFVEDLSGQ